MEAPEKIYVHRTIHLGLLEASEMNITGSDIEYTRTDAFIEKAADYIKKDMLDNLAFQGRLNRIKIIVELLRSLLKQ